MEHKFATGGYLNLSIQVKGRPITEYSHEGQTFVEGRDGSEFEITFKNMTLQNRLVVLSVDGLSIMDGKPASAKSGGYVVKGYETVKIPGWRLNNADVARFVFGDKKASYAAATDQDTRNVGVIGAAVFAEKERWNLHGALRAMNSAGHMTLGGSPPQSKGISLRGSGADASRSTDTFSMGTGFGERSEHRVSETTFERSNEPPILLSIYYDNARGLRRRGIVVGERLVRGDVPNPFPADVGCTPPVGWKG